jgi:hypothetical protein
VALRFAASALGGGGRVALGGEAVRPGCSRVTCTDLAPDAPAVMVLTVAKGA